MGRSNWPVGFAVAAAAVTLCLAEVPGAAAPRADQSSASSVSAAGYGPLLQQYCLTCHNERLKTGGLSLEGLDSTAVESRSDVWEKVIRKLRAGMMPPVGRPRPDGAAESAFVSWLERQLDRAAAAHPDPGRVDTFHRLNRAEYHNAIRDVLALDIDVSALLPADSFSYGFDNIAGVLKVSDSLMEQYLSAARRISRIAVGAPPPGPVAEKYRLAPDVQQADRAEDTPFGTRGGMVVRHHFPVDAEYLMQVELSPGGNPSQLEVAIDGEPIKQFDVTGARRTGVDGEEESGAKYELQMPVKAGPHAVRVAFFKRPSLLAEANRRAFLNPANGGASQASVRALTITGPFGQTARGDTPSRRRIFVCRPSGAAGESACAREILSALARRAYRRPADQEDLKTLVAAFDEGRARGDFEGGIERALYQLLVSPEFLFRVESDPSTVAAGATTYRISDLALASRLSFFLWSSVPDDELLEAASRGRLKDQAVLVAQVRRMLADPKSVALTENFAGQWLQLRGVDGLKPSAVLFPDFDATLRQSFRRETELFFDSILREDRSLLDLLRADYTFLNERLARHYSIPNVKGSHFRRVVVADENRRGLLGHGSILTVTSHATRTSPVVRGKWILENILGTPPPPPPANVPALPDSQGVYAATGRMPTMRERMAQHRANPTCAGCHSMIDPAGFALENFDPIGRWREVDTSFNPIDASGNLPDGTRFNGVRELRAALLQKPERFVFTVTEKLLTYALGRGLESSDMPTVRGIVRGASRDDYKLSSLIAGIVASQPFVMRRLESQAPPRVAAATQER